MSNPTSTSREAEADPPDNELREQIEAMVGRWFGEPVMAVEDEIMELIAQAKQAWTVEERRDELESAYNAHPGIDTEYLDQRLAELQPPTAESEAEA